MELLPGSLITNIIIPGSLITNNIANGMMMKYIHTIPLARRTLSQALPVEAMEQDEEL